MARGGGNVVLKDVLDIKEDAHAGDFKIELSRGFGDDSAGSVADYVVTEQLAKEFDKALKLVRGAVRKNSSYAAYLHGSFGSGKSHFLTVLHAVLNGESSVQGKPRLREVLAEHREWLGGRKFLMVPYHLIGADNLESALLGGYVKTVRALPGNVSVPTVYKSDALLADARALRESIGDDAFIRLLGDAATAGPSVPRPPSQATWRPSGPVPPRSGPATNSTPPSPRPPGTWGGSGWCPPWSTGP
jgi:hypothetical protein